ncbi:MAG: PAS domain S-box protein [Isosphaeraceae bacterium]
MANLGAPFVLVVEDDRDTRANLRDILELDDYRVEEAATAAEALEERDWSGYLAILLDRRLPDGTAADVLPRLRRLAPESAVIVVTGHGDVDGAIDAIRQGAIDYLLKPIDPEVLRTRLGRIAEHRRLEESGRESERFARSVLDSLDAHVAVLDHSGTILAVNRAWRDFAATNGAAVADVSEGADYFATCARAAGEDGETAWAFAAGIHDVLAGRRGSFELEYACHAPERRRWFVGRVTPFLGDGPRRVVVAHVNITERRLAEAAMRRADQRFRHLVQNSSDVITALAADGTVLYQSPSIRRVLDYHPESRIGTNVFVNSIVHPEDLPRKRAFLEEARREPGKPVSSEFRLRHADGTWRTIEAVGQNLLSDPSVGAIIANYRDITERKLAEERALQAERLAAIGQMVAGLAHESRNALQRGQANLEMLALEVGEQARARELIDRQQRALDDLTRLYDEVRNYAAPIRLELCHCELPTLWRRTWDDLEPARAARRAELREDIACSGLHCVADPHRIGQVFRNLLENALAACPDPVEIAFGCAPCEHEGRPAVRVAVRDNGPGLGMTRPERVFEPFFTTKTKGTGLGLAIARRVVEAHGGRIEAVSRYEGAEFVIILPREGP